MSWVNSVQRQFLANGPIQCPREKQKKTDDRTIETIEETKKEAVERRIEKELIGYGRS